MSASGEFPFWVMSRHPVTSASCPLFSSQADFGLLLSAQEMSGTGDLTLRYATSATGRPSARKSK
jgi:hypothetical protein